MKKYLSVLIILAMVLAMAVPVLAASGATVTTSMKGNDVIVTVTDGSVKATTVVAFEKNKELAYDVGGYGVEIEYNGSGVKSAKIVSVPDAVETPADTNENVAAPAGAPVYLGGSGSSFSKAGWQNVFYLGGAETASDPNVWHLVIAPPKEADSVTYMQITFTNGETFIWDASMGFSSNGGGHK